ncbi:hypothetical protein [Haloarcula amylovorans]|nr:hypothetical protein [Halomicroarcula amylolytica]
MNDCNVPADAFFDCNGRIATALRHRQSAIERTWEFSGGVSGDRA